LNETKFVFVFDTSFFWSLLDVHQQTCLEDISEIFNLYPNLEYVVPRTVLYELQGKHKDKINYIQRIFTIETRAISDSDIRHLIELNRRSKTRFFQTDEKGDYKIIQTALNRKSKTNVVMIVSNDEGIHKFVLEYLSSYPIRAIWVPWFVSFLSHQAPDNVTKKRLKQTAELLKSYIVNYRQQTERGIIPIRDIEQILLSSSLVPSSTQIFAKEFQQFLQQPCESSTLPKYLKNIGEFIQKLFSYIELEDSLLIEETLEKLFSYLYNLSVRERENTKTLIAPYLVKIYSSLASIYDKQGFISATISALERSRTYLDLLNDNTTIEQIYALLSWVHLFSSGLPLARYYFQKVKSLENQFVRRLRVLMNLIFLSDENSLEDIYSQLSDETWSKLLNIAKICHNPTLKNRLQTIIDKFQQKKRFSLDARHFTIKDASIDDNEQLNFLKWEFVIIDIQPKSNYFIIKATNERTGELEFRCSKIKKLQIAKNGDILSFKSGVVKNISKPRPGSTVNATIYLDISDDHIEITKTSKLM